MDRDLDSWYQDGYEAGMEGEVEKWKKYTKQAIEVIRNNVAPLSLYDREGDIIDEIENALKQLP